MQSVRSGPNRFTTSVVAVMQRLYPERFADRSWDNVGLLLENTDDQRQHHRVLLTTDLTSDVADEAIECDATVVVAYHPIIFKGLKALSLGNPQQTSLIRLMQRNIAVYCPHTALDAQADGINDWLADKVDAAVVAVGSRIESRSVVQPLDAAVVQQTTGDDNKPEPTMVGYGRRLKLAHAVDAHELVRAFAKQMGDNGGMKHVLIAAPRVSSDDAGVDFLSTIWSVSVCAGSGADVLRDADHGHVYVTGEMSHHAALAAVSKGAWVVCVLHSNSERLFLRERLQPQLAAELSERYSSAAVLVSERDRDPFEIWDVDTPPRAETKLSASFAV